ncbi:MAG: 2-C-methyl-D-erythritol 4-phosphate cytidylyltransferase [Desulfovibrionaceae bacterium]|jgi:2-C-methyl-D-erythritol 4-phosphate cytidylyltransferase/2-C-methyl-D-erythritol 2,4-cyclodiphosphate synthase|nr:2-C-methyl-D-erythritol 4-phosphate cytidylyltransferase [Desulfovibrionaceae bacterium]
MSETHDIWAVILAAGKGSRLAEAGIPTRKQFLEYEGAPLFWRSALTMARVPAVQGLVFVFPPDGFEDALTLTHELMDAQDPGLPWKAVPGGERRQDSVFEGLSVLPEGCDCVLVHDAARPFASAALVSRLCAELLDGTPAVIPCVSVRDTVKRVHDGLVVETLRRDALRAVQTPQGFDRDVLVRAHKRARARDWEVTDDASMVERLDVPVAVIAGEEANVKITTVEDLAMLGATTAPAEPCVGFGYDVHAFTAPDAPDARPLKLGGVPIPGGAHVAAHSDGDVLLHALADGLLGCLGGGDIGQRFPDDDPRFENVESAVLVAEVLAETQRAGLRVTHVDLTVVAQAPRLSPHREDIRRTVARLLALDERRVNVKATTEEKLGFTGEGKGIKAMAAVTALRAAVPPSPDEG